MSDIHATRPPRFQVKTDVPVLAVSVLILVATFIVR